MPYYSGAFDTSKAAGILKSIQERQSQIDAAIEKLQSGESKNVWNDAEATRAAGVMQGLAAGHTMDAAQLVADALDRSTSAAGQGTKI